MSTWSIEHIPAAGGASTFASLTVWGIAAGALTLRNWDMDELVLTLSTSTALLADTPWQFRDKLVVWRDGVRVFHGWVTEPARTADPASEAQQIRVSGPWWWLANTPMRDPVGYMNLVITPTTIPTPNGDVVVDVITGVTWTTPAGAVVWHSWIDQSIYHMQGQIHRALYAALWAGAPVGIGEIGLNGRAPVQSSRNATCAAWLQSAARYEPLGVQWWDYAGEVPVFRCAPRSGASAYTLPFAALQASSGITLTPLYAQQAHAVRVRYWYTGTAGEELYLDDKAGDNAWPEGPGALVVSAEVSTVEEAAQAWWEHIAQRLYDALSPLAWAGSLQLTEDGAALPWLRPGNTLSISGGRTEWAAMAALVQEVTYAFGPESEDTVGLTLGAPDHLGVQDWLELSQLATGSAGAGPKTDTGSRPGSLDDLLGDGFFGLVPEFALEGRYMALDCWLGGFAALDGSEPTRRWLTRTGSGTIRWDGNSGPSSYLPCAHLYTLSGVQHYDAATLVCTGTIARSYAGAGAGIGVGGYCLGSPVDPPTASCGCGTDYWCGTLGESSSVSATVLTKVPTESGWSGAHMVTLSEEDTEEAARARAEATASWTAWSSSLVAAAYEERTVTVTWAMVIVDYRGSGTGATPGWTYEILIHTEQQPYGGGSWSAGEDIVVQVTAAADGSITLPARELSCPRGYRRRIAGFDGPSPVKGPDYGPTT